MNHEYSTEQRVKRWRLEGEGQCFMGFLARSVVVISSSKTCMMPRYFLPQAQQNHSAVGRAHISHGSDFVLAVVFSRLSFTMAFPYTRLCCYVLDSLTESHSSRPIVGARHVRPCVNALLASLARLS